MEQGERRVGEAWAQRVGSEEMAAGETPPRAAAAAAAAAAGTGPAC